MELSPDFWYDISRYLAHYYLLGLGSLPNSDSAASVW
jgi:hypothetical protein